MKFGETFSEYLHGDQAWFLDKVSHVEYKRLKKVLKNCSRCRPTNGNSEEESDNLKKFCRSNSCPGSLLGQRRNFKSKMQSKRIELLQSPCMIKLGAFYLNYESRDSGDDFVRQFCCDLSNDRPAMTLSDSMKLKYNLTCPICLDIIFHPYALGCGHLFCKGCICSAASVLIFDGPKFASPESKCPVCRSVGVYEDSVHLVELDLLLKNRCKKYWKERLNMERAQAVKQSKEFWDLQTKHVLGIY